MLFKGFKVFYFKSFFYVTISRKGCLIFGIEFDTINIKII